MFLILMMTTECGRRTPAAAAKGGGEGE